MDAESLHVLVPRDYNRIKTTITLRMGTKNRLGEIARKGESFDDVINRLISRNESLEARIAETEVIDPGNNRLESVELERGINSVRLSDGSIVRFSYNKPEARTDENYSLDITIDEMISEGGLVEMDLRLFSDVYFHCLQKIINIHFDRSFTISGNRNLLDPVYWQRIWDRIGLHGHSFDRDILRFIVRSVEGEHGGNTRDRS